MYLYLIHTDTKSAPHYVSSKMNVYKIQNTQKIKENALYVDKTGQTCKFSRKSSFSSYEQHKNRKTNNSFI